MSNCFSNGFPASYFPIIAKDNLGEGLRKKQENHYGIFTHSGL